MTDDELRDALAAIRAAGDQVKASAKELSEIVVLYWHGLVDGGIPPEYATTLACALTDSVFTLGTSKDPEEGGDVP